MIVFKTCNFKGERVSPLDTETAWILRTKFDLDRLKRIPRNF